MNHGEFGIIEWWIGLLLVEHKDMLMKIGGWLMLVRAAFHLYRHFFPA